MYDTEILTTIQMAHHFHSAYTRDQAYQLTQVKMEREEFEIRVDRLVAKSCIWERREHLYEREAAVNLPVRVDQKKSWSRQFFNTNRNYLRRVSMIPWIQFIGLTGSNSFESCTVNDDLDLFLITDRDRLWLTMLVIGAMRRISPAKALCLNYLVDEDYLHIPVHTHFTAVQIVQMIPIYNSPMKVALMKANQWIFDFLPNASIVMSGNKSYALPRHRRYSAFLPFDRVCRGLNHFVFRKRYRDRLTQLRNLPGRNVDIRIGVAKLHGKDHSDIYGRMRPRPLQTSSL